MKKSITLLYALLLTVLGATQAHADDYYLVGERFGWTAQEEYKFSVNPGNTSEYMLSTTLEEGDEIKVMCPTTNAWYPDGNNVYVDGSHAGNVTIYFKPEYNDNWANFGGYMYIQVNSININSIYLAGDDWLAGDPWVSDVEGNKLNEVKDNIWEILVKNVPAGEHIFKFTVNGSWSNSFGINEVGTAELGVEYNATFNDFDDNISFNLEEAADLLIRLDINDFEYSTKQGAKFTILTPMDLELVDNDTEGDNLSIIEACDGELTNITLKDRTLFKDGYWNTLCLPFDVDLTDTESPLYGADVEKLAEASIEGTTLYLTFQQVTDKVKAGVPYIVKWAAASDITDPEFKNVIIKNTLVPAVFGNVSFVGSFSNSELPANDKTNLFLGADNSLFYPNTDVTLGAFRGYFHINNESLAKMIDDAVINFYDQAPTSIRYALSQNEQTANQGWYTLSGQRLGAKPAKAGIYVVNGKKIIIK